MVETGESNLMNKLFKFKGIHTKSIDIVIEQYLAKPTTKNEGVDINSWWNLNNIQFLKLSSFAIAVLSCQTTSLAKERVFSESGTFVSKKEIL